MCSLQWYTRAVKNENEFANEKAQIVKIGANIKRIRESRQMSAEKLAELSGVSRQTIYSIEYGKVPEVAYFHLLKIATALGVKFEELSDAKEAIATMKAYELIEMVRGMVAKKEIEKKNKKTV